ncbi:MAG: hypothetical protein RIC35_19450 [Marinoscillum sp.]
MKNLTIICILILSSDAIKAQSKAEDQLILNQAIEWLEDKLTYNYFNVEDDEWWINRFTFNDASKTVTIKNIASPHLEAVSDKTYLQLNFRLEDLNPYTIQVQQSLKNNGRLVKGKTIRVGAFDKSISRSKNGTLSTNQSFIYFSIPEFFEDSVENYTQNIVDKITSAVLLSTKIYAGSDEENIKSLYQVIDGRFIANNQYWEVSNLFADTYSIDVINENNETQARYFIKVLSGSKLELTAFLKDQSTQMVILDKLEGSELIYGNSEIQWYFKNANEVEISSGAEKQALIRDWTFLYSNPKSR